MPSETRRPEPPERLGPYRLDQLLGSGGMGAVWRAWDERLDRWVALKQIRAGATLRHGRERLRREARAVARLSHPAIVHVYDILEGADGDWIVMELVEGRTLRRLLDEEGALPPPRAVRLCREIAEGLAEAHAQGILHRDLKASNVIVGPSGRAKILDFGLAKEIPREGEPEDQDLTGSTPGMILGTCFAMSPEQALGRPLDERSDLFSLGSLLHEMLTGEAPFQAENVPLSLARVVDHEVPPLQVFHPAIRDLVSRLLQKDPLQRPQSAAEVIAALDTAAGSGGEDLARSRTLVWSGASTASTVAEAPVRAPRPAADGKRPQSGGERRTVTIVCCALVPPRGSAGEVSALDVEVLSEATAAFEALGREICQELAGSLGAVLNRTLWLCFGYPRAHEDDAERAVRAAWELQERFAALPVAAACRLAVRAGLHTGPAVVVTRSSTGPALQPGDISDIAMAVQGQVPAGGIGVSAASRQLLDRRFATQPLPPVHVKDLDATVEVFELGPAVEPEGWEGGPPSPLVSREAELRILLDRFRRARSGEGQAVLISGEAGIGKSRLVRALAELLAADAPVWLIAHASAFAQNTPLGPIVHLLSRAVFASGAAEPSGEEKLRRLEEALDGYGLPRPDHAPLLGALLSLPVEGRYPPLVLSPEARRKRTLASILALLGAMAEQRPVVLVIEDLHWIDPSTLDLIGLLLAEIPELPLLFVATFRPELSVPWRHQTSVTQLSLRGLSEADTVELIERIPGGERLPAEVRREIVARTDGIPLFIEELTKTLLEGDAALRKPAGVPLTLGGSLLARLDRLGEAKAVAQLASVIGRTFTLEQLEALSWIKGAALRAALEQLLQAEILHRRGPASRARYVFKHALIQDAAHLSLLASDRQQLHRRLVRLLQEDFPAVAGDEPELMAHHCEHGGLTAEAVGYLQKAGQRAMGRSALLEAVRHLTRAVDLLLALPETPERSERELTLRLAVGAVLPAIRGWGAAEVGANAGRCVALCRDLGDHGRLIPSLYALWDHHLMRGESRPAIELAEEIARLAETPVEVFIGCVTRGQTIFETGRFAETLALLEQAAALFEPRLHPELAQVFGEESSLMSHLFHFWALAMTGRPDTAVREQEAVLAAVETQGAPFLLSMALTFEMILWHQLLSPERVAEVAERLRSLAYEQEFALLLSFAHVGRGWAACQRGDLAGGTAEIEKGLELREATGAQLVRRYQSSYLVEAHLAAGRITEGLAAVREILVLPEGQLGGSFLDSELHRLEGELLRASGDAAAEASFRKALGIARGQGARAFELRAATSLGRLLADQDRGAEALPPLAALYATFDEGFATRDLQEARELLERLERGS
ncbi:MAG: protein kinase domain-containing protein [Thermoanaerobaculia bacterium]